MSFQNYAKIFANSIFFMQTPLSNDAGTEDRIYIYLSFVMPYPPLYLQRRRMNNGQKKNSQETCLLFHSVKSGK